MKQMFWLSVVFWLAAGGARADLITLSTSDPPGTPLRVSAGANSGPMLLTIVNNTNSDIPANLMTAWNVHLVIVPNTGATGTLTFRDPVTGAYTPGTGEPSNYVFAGDNTLSGISVTNTGTSLAANDFADNPVQVPAGAGANLLLMDFHASANASGLFGIFAVEGLVNTQWTDNEATQMTRFFTNVPNGSGTVRIGEVLVQPAVPTIPEPSSLDLFCLSGTTLVICGWWRKRKRHEQ